ncbi:unnamed protein product [Polarella glacialis]|uniref:Uncharacterized protein n=1 Tax=Polarella glacialis TaxID=89957 RepID=A0A813JI90_POLGL|nr:unnamed protein product [Polarella glacialis]CAE8677340.1 unnamed protein product [Polarella glacialis]
MWNPRLLARKLPRLASAGPTSTGKLRLRAATSVATPKTSPGEDSGPSQATEAQLPVLPQKLLLQKLLHPQRSKATLEFLARPAEVIAGACSVVHIALLHPAKETARIEVGGKARWEALELLLEHFPKHSDVLRIGPGYWRGQLSENFWCRWQLHDSFHTYTFFCRQGGEEDACFQMSPLDLVPAEWFATLAEQTLVAGTRLELQPRMEKLCHAELTEKLGVSSRGNIYGSDVHAGTAQAFTDFRIRSDGFSRILVKDSRLFAREDSLPPLLGSLPGVAHPGPGRLVHQLLAMEDFKCLSLIGEPWAGHLHRRVEEVSLQHLRLLRDVEKRPDDQIKQRRWWHRLRFRRDYGGEADEILLDRLVKLHMVLEAHSAKCKPKLQHCHVYYLRTKDMAHALQEKRLEGFLPIGEFTRLRLEDLERDRSAVQVEVSDLSVRMQRSVELLRVGVTLTQMGVSHQTAVKVERLTALAVVLSMLFGLGELRYLVEEVSPQVALEWLIGLVAKVETKLLLLSKQIT